MMMVCRFAGNANRIFRLKLVVRNPVQNSSLYKLTKASVNCSPVYQTIKFQFKVIVGKGVWLMEKLLQNLDPLGCMSQLIISKKMFGRSMAHGANLDSNFT